MSYLLAQFITKLLAAGGYSAFFLLSFLDSTVLPVPNETFMPFAGSLIASGAWNPIIVLILSTLGAVLGSLTSYAIGFYGANKFVKKFGKFVKINETDLARTKAFFDKHGDRTILIARFITVVRQFSSIPAGAGQMSLKKFCFYTALGSLIWNSIMIYLGFLVGTHTEVFSRYSHWLDLTIVVVITIGLLLWLKKYWQSKSQSKTNLTKTN